MIASILRQTIPRPEKVDHITESSELSDESLLGTMLENFGSLDLDDKGRWNYSGHSSTIIFMQRLQNQFGNLITPTAKPFRSGLGAQYPESSVGLSRPFDDYSGVSQSFVLPVESTARELCRVSFDQACIPNRFIHEPSFWASFDQVYATSWDRYGAGERVFLPLLYAAIAVGCLFSDIDKSTNVLRGGQLFEQG